MTKTPVPHASEILNAFGEKGWDLRGYFSIPGKGDLISRVPINERVFLIGMKYVLTPKAANPEDLLSFISHMRYLRSEGLGSRIYLGNGAEFSTEGAEMAENGAVFIPTKNDAAALQVSYEDLEKVVSECFGPNLITHKNI